MLATVNGGTSAGVKRALRPANGKPWQCPHGHQNPAFAASCLDGRCRERRPT